MPGLVAIHAAKFQSSTALNANCYIFFFIRPKPPCDYLTLIMKPVDWHKGATGATGERQTPMMGQLVRRMDAIDAGLSQAWGYVF